MYPQLPTKKMEKFRMERMASSGQAKAVQHLQRRRLRGNRCQQGHPLMLEILQEMAHRFLAAEHQLQNRCNPTRTTQRNPTLAPTHSRIGLRTRYQADPTFLFLATTPPIDSHKHEDTNAE